MSGRCDKCQKSTLSFDIYRQPFRLLLPDDMGMYRTFLGTILSLMTLVLPIVYAGFKMSALVNF